MSRQAQDREDLLREATALLERAELRVDGCDDPLIVGFRRNGAASFYFGADPVFQFNAECELRRCYFTGRLVKAEEGTLFWLDRVRTADESILQRTQLAASELELLSEQVASRLETLGSDLRSGRFELVGQVPKNADVIGRVIAWLEQASLPPAIAASPRVGG